VKPSTLRDWFLRRKHLDFVKVGRAVCVTEDSIERFIAANTIPAREAKITPTAPRTTTADHLNEQVVEGVAERGFRLFPAEERGQRPLIEKCPERATCDAGSSSAPMRKES